MYKRQILRCLEIDIAKLHTDRKDKLIVNLNNMQTIKALMHLLHNNLTTRQITEKLGINKGTNITKNFNNMFLYGFVEKKKNSKIYSYSLTERSKKLLSAFHVA